jgi:predicted SAM-dependent methyltransferase
MVMRRVLLGLFSHRTLALLRWDIYFMKVRINNFLFSKRSDLKKRLSLQSERKYLNLGSGPRGIDSAEWINIDGFPDTNVHYLCDFNKRLPFGDNSFDGIFCEHVLEHFDYDNGSKLMRECLRLLKPGGTVRIIVPDGNKFLKAYFDDPEFVIKYKGVQTGHAMEAVNIWFYQRYEHQCIYDAPYLISMLENAGYSKAAKASFGLSALGPKDIVIDDEKYAWESLYVEAVK